jgi:hypothetical protein
MTMTMTLFLRLFGICLVITHWVLFVSISLLILLINRMDTLVLLITLQFAILVFNIIYDDCPISLVEDALLGNNLVDLSIPITPFKVVDRMNYCLQVIFSGLMLSLTKLLLLLLRSSFREFLLERI